MNVLAATIFAALIAISGTAHASIQFGTITSKDPDIHHEFSVEVWENNHRSTTNFEKWDLSMSPVVYQDGSKAGTMCELTRKQFVRLKGNRLGVSAITYNNGGRGLECEFNAGARYLKLSFQGIYHTITAVFNFEFVSGTDGKDSLVLKDLKGTAVALMAGENNLELKLPAKDYDLPATVHLEGLNR